MGLIDPNQTRQESYLAQPGCRVFNNANLAIGAAAWTALTFNSERFDPFGMHAAGAATIVVNVPGHYLVGGSAEFANPIVGLQGIAIRLNGATLIATQFHTSVGAGLQHGISTLWDAVAADTFELVVYTVIGVNVLFAGDYSPEFWAQRVG